MLPPTEGGEPAAILQTVLGQKVFSVNGAAEFNSVVITGGDSVDATCDFSDFAVAPNPSCFPMELVRNPGFELTVGGSGPLQIWKPTVLEDGNGQSCGDDDRVLILTGDGTRKRPSGCPTLDVGTSPAIENRFEHQIDCSKRHRFCHIEASYR